MGSALVGASWDTRLSGRFPGLSRPALMSSYCLHFARLSCLGKLPRGACLLFSCILFGFCFCDVVRGTRCLWLAVVVVVVVPCGVLCVGRRLFPLQLYAACNCGTIGAFGRFDLAALCGCRTLNFCLFCLFGELQITIKSHIAQLVVCHLHSLSVAGLCFIFNMNLEWW